MHENQMVVAEQSKVFLYLRVSTQDQNVESQKFALLEYCSRQGLNNYEMFIDHGISGAKESRPALNEMMAKVEKQECSQVIVFSFSRFARSVSHLLKALQKFREKNIRFNSITEQLDTNSPMGLALFTILGALAQMEREIIRNRVIAGLQNAKAKGKKIGRERKRNDMLIHSLLEAGLSFREISRIALCSHGSVSASKKELLAKKAKQKAEQDAKSLTDTAPTFVAESNIPVTEIQPPHSESNVVLKSHIPITVI
jgi:DNA invertase Pin-like site-specific DNA recombinase